MGVQCFGQGYHQNIDTQEECACLCAADPDCTVYSFCPANSLFCGKGSPSPNCGAGKGCANTPPLSNCTTQECNWVTWGKPGTVNPFPDCSVMAPPIPFPATGVLPAFARPGARVGDGWGINFHFNEYSGKSEELDLVAPAFRVARLDMSWKSVEPEGACGTYNFSSYDAQAAAFLSRGVTPFFLLAYWSPCYDGGSPCTSDECVEAFGAFGAAAMEHFKGQNVAFECQNEPQGE